MTENRNTSRVNLLKYIMLLLFTASIICFVNANSVSAEEEESNAGYYIGTATGTVNVRTGPGTEYDNVEDDNKEKMKLIMSEEVIIIGEAEASNGKIWYNIKLNRDGKTYIGYATSSYIAKNDSPITPTPTPIPTPTPSPTPTPTPAPTSSPTPTQQLIPETTTTPNDKNDILKTILYVIIVAILILVALIIYKILRDKKSKSGNAASKKVDKLKKMNLEDKDGSKKLPQIKRFDSDSTAEEVRQDVYYKKSSDSLSTDDLKRSAEKDSDEKKALRAAIERLQDHDIVYHTTYGEGEVCDNSDVKLLQVRFGNDIRFLKKEQLVARHELLIIDEEEQTIARRKNRRKNNN